MKKTQKETEKRRKTSKKAQDLRGKAERMLFLKKPADPPVSIEDSAKLIQELRVHQIELEMQNEELRKAQEEIEESRSRFVDLFDFAPIPYFTFDGNGAILEVNFKGAELLGLERQVLIRKPFSNFVLPDDRDTFRKHRQDSLRQPSRQRCELRVKRKDGSVWDVTMESIAGKDSKDDVPQVRSAVWDVTELKEKGEEIRRLNVELEEKVRRRTAELRKIIAEMEKVEIKMHKARDEAELDRKQLRTIMETIPSGLVIIEKPDGRISYVNSRALELYGRKPKLGTKMAEHSLELKMMMQDGTLFSSENLPTSRALLHGETVRQVEMLIEQPDGKRIPILAHASPLHNEAGEIFGAVGIFHDISQRKKAEEALREGEERLRFALETSHTGAWDLDLVDHTAHRSLEHDRIFGYEQLLPQWTYEMFLDHVLPEDRGAVDAEFRQAVESQGNWSFECRIRRSDGEIRWIWAAGRHRTETAGQLRRMAGIVQDITERKEAENQIRKLIEELTRKNLHLEWANRELDAYTSSVSHDLKNPLVVIGNVTDRLIKKYGEIMDAKGKQYLQMLASTSGRMTELVDDLLELSRVSKASLKREKVDLSGLAESLLAEYREKEPARKVESSIPPGVSCRGDWRLLRSLLDNLLSNAWKFTRDCDPARIEVGGFWEGMDPIYFVRDNGCGFVVPQDMAQVFTPFQRHHDPAEYPGTGIGLATVNRIIVRHGGRVWVESALGKGTTVYFTLPE